MKNNILTLIIGILIGAIIMACIFVVYTKINEKDEVADGIVDNVPNIPDAPNPPENDGFQFKGIPEGVNGSNDGFQKGPRGDLNKNETELDRSLVNENRTNKE